MAETKFRKKIFVFTDSSRQGGPILMGRLNVSEVRGKEIFSFEYNDGFLNSKWAFEMDPDLRLYKGSQYLPDEQSNFGIFLDSSPDRWGRVLMDRREAVKARTEERSAKRLMESDYLKRSWMDPFWTTIRIELFHPLPQFGNWSMPVFPLKKMKTLRVKNI